MSHRSVALLVLVFFSAALHLACAPRVCVPGTTQACLGPAQCAGVQSCNAAGTGYDACFCSSGSGGGSGGSGGGTGGGTGGGIGGGSGGSGGGGTSSGLKPDVMILLDKSGSMASPTDASNPNCPASSCPGPSCPSNCPTRISEVRTGLTSFLTNFGSAARYGFTTFPVDATCGAPTGVRIDISQSNDVSSELAQTADAIRTQVAAIGITGAQPAGSPSEVGGGTPIGGALALFENYTLLAEPLRADFVLLITDGLPNCNPSNPNTCLNASACKCTTTNCGTSSTAPFCSLGCLDQDGAVAAATALANRGIKTVVVGFGADTTSGDAPAALNAIAQAGGAPQSCPGGLSAECGANATCNASTHLCSRAYYQASNATELGTVLSAIANNVLR